MKSKILLSLFFILGFFLIRIGGRIMTNKLKSFHEKNNPKLVERAPWIFTFFIVFSKVSSIMCLIFVVLIWTGFVNLTD